MGEFRKAAQKYYIMVAFWFAATNSTMNSVAGESALAFGKLTAVEVFVSSRQLRQAPSRILTLPTSSWCKQTLVAIKLPNEIGKVCVGEKREQKKDMPHKKKNAAFRAASIDDESTNCTRRNLILKFILEV
jgi:hypothetical protein